MKFALMMDDCAIESYYIKDGKAYDYNDKPFIYHHAVSPECMIAMQNLPYLFDEGYFFFHVLLINTFGLIVFT